MCESPCVLIQMYSIQNVREETKRLGFPKQFTHIHTHPAAWPRQTNCPL